MTLKSIFCVCVCSYKISHLNIAFHWFADRWILFIYKLLHSDSQLFFGFETVLNREVFVGYSTLSYRVQILVAQNLLDAWLLNLSFPARTSCGYKTTNTAFLKVLIPLSTNKAHHCVDFLCLTYHFSFSPQVLYTSAQSAENSSTGCTTKPGTAQSQPVSLLIVLSWKKWKLK